MSFQKNDLFFLFFEPRKLKKDDVFFLKGMNSPSSIFEMPQFIVVGPAFFRNFKIVIFGSLPTPICTCYALDQTFQQGIVWFSTMLSHFNLCPVKTAKAACETSHTPVNHCEI
jgi:hypothetical protein